MRRHLPNLLSVVVIACSRAAATTGNVPFGVLPLGKYGSEGRSPYARRRRLDDSNDAADDDADDDASLDEDDGDDCDDASHDADDDAKEDRPEAIDGEERSPLSPRERGGRGRRASAPWTPRSSQRDRSFDDSSSRHGGGRSDRRDGYTTDDYQKYREDDAEDVTVDTCTDSTYDPPVRGVVSATPTTSLADYTSVQREKEARIVSRVLFERAQVLKTSDLGLAKCRSDLGSSSELGFPSHLTRVLRYSLKLI